MKTTHTYLILVIAVAAISSGLTFQVIGLADNAPSTTGDNSGINGHITATLYDEDGYVKAYQQTDNRIVDRGLDIIGDLVFGLTAVTGESIIDAMGIGISTAISAPGQTDLQDRTGLSGCANQTFTFIEGDASASLINVTSGTVSFSGATCAGAITEAALFDDSTGTNSGNMFARQQFGVINVGSSDQLDITWTVQIDDDLNE